MGDASYKNLRPGCFQKVKHILSNITAEPILIFFNLPFVMLLLVSTNLFLDKSCRVNLKLNKTICDGLVARNTSMYNKADEEAVQKLVTSMNIWRNVIQSILPIIFLSFIGSWSDKHKLLKPTLIFPVVGGLIKTVGLLLSVGFFYQINMEATGALEVIPSSLLGSAPTLGMGVYHYVSMLSSKEMLTLRLGFVKLCNFVSYTLGVASGGVLLQLIGYYGIFSIALGLYCLSILYTVVCIKEVNSSSSNGKKSSSSFGSLKDFLNFQHAINTVRTSLRKREKNYRLRIVLLFLLTIMEKGPQVGEVNVVYLYTRIRFQWSELDFSLFYIYHLILNVVGLVIVLLVCSKLLKLDDACLGIIGSLSKTAFCVLAAFAPNSLVFYLAVLIEMYATVTNVAIRSIITKIIAHEELGKVFSVLSMFEALPILIYGPLYNAVYKMTIDTFPGTFYLLGAGLTFPTIPLFVWFWLQHRKDKQEVSGSNQ